MASKNIMPIKSLIDKSNKSPVGISGNLSSIKSFINITQDQIDFQTKIVPIEMLNDWSFDKITGNFFHDSKRFFSLQGLQSGNEKLPILVQQEIGILGFLAANFDGIFHLLVQLKVEPGNPNGFQISPTVQATRSNYSQVHGGKLPPFLEFFIPGRVTKTVRDSYQSEQGWRYYRKRNRNLIVFTENPPEPSASHIWMTLHQIKELSKKPLLINSCARSVLSMLPIAPEELRNEEFLLHEDHEIFSKLLDSHDLSIDHSNLINLNEINNWFNDDGCFRNDENNNFNIIGVEVSGISREVKSWMQPLLREKSEGEYGLLIATINGIPQILWKLRNEPGLIKGAELGPTWINRGQQNESDSWGFKIHQKGKELIKIALAEEGGRFFESIFNHKIISIGEVSKEELGKDIIPLSLKQTERFISNYSLLTIEARSLWSLMRSEWFE